MPSQVPDPELMVYTAEAIALFVSPLCVARASRVSVAVTLIAEL
jgi:hypothetical protein